MKHARPYLVAWVALVILAGLSFLLAEAHLGAAGTPVAFAIAAVKGSIVVIAFMHFARARASVHLAAFVGMMLFALLIGLAAADIATRDPPPLLPPDGVETPHKR